MHPGLMGKILEGCLSVGTRVRMESRVVGVAGFGPGTPVGAQGSLGPRGEPGKTNVFCPHLEDCTLMPRPEVTLEAGPSQALPPSPVGYTGSGGEPGSRFS